MRHRRLAAFTAGFALVLGPAVMAAVDKRAVTFKPASVVQGGTFAVRAPAQRGQALTIRLAHRRSRRNATTAGVVHGGSDGWASGTARARVAPGRYWVLACRRSTCLISTKRLRVKRKGSSNTGSGNGSGGGNNSGGSPSPGSGGTGTTTPPGAGDAPQYEVRLVSDMPLSWSPTTQPPPVSEPHGTGSADYKVNGTADLSGDPTTTDGASGNGTLTWANFSYSDVNVQNLCQDGKYMNTTYTGTNSEPGAFKVSNLTITSPSGAAADPGVTLEFTVSQEPSETIHIVYSKGNTACADFTTDNTYHDWAELYLPQGTSLASGTTGFKGQQAAGGWTYTVTGWTRASGPAGQNGTLVATKDLTYAIRDGKGGNGDPGGTGTAHVTFEIVAVPQTPSAP